MPLTPLEAIALALEDKFGDLHACQLAALDAEYAQFVAEHGEPYESLLALHKEPLWASFILRHEEPHAYYLITKALGLLPLLTEPEEAPKCQQ